MKTVTVTRNEFCRSTSRILRQSVIDSLTISSQDFGPASSHERWFDNANFTNASGSRGNYVWGCWRQKERQKEESDKGSVEKEMERESEKQHRVQASGVSLAAVSTPRNANEPRETNQGATTVTRSLRGVDRCLITEAEPNSLSLSPFFPL